jgi:hypothetical protein
VTSSCALFPERLDSEGKAWTHQGREAKVLMAQMAGWLAGVIEAADRDKPDHSSSP